MKTQSGCAMSVAINGNKDDRLLLSRFTGDEWLGRPFLYKLDLRWRDDICDLADFLDQPVTLKLVPQHPENPDDIPAATKAVHGVISDATIRGRSGHDFLVAVTLVPRLALLDRSRRSRIYMLSAKQTIPDVIEQVLKDHRLEPGTDFDLSRLQRDSYPQRDYVVQYEETDLAFLQRWMEHEGIFYRFDMSGSVEKIVFCDAKSHYEDLTGSGETKIPFRPAGGSGTAVGVANLFSIGTTRSVIPNHVIMQDYNWRANTWRDPAGSMLMKGTTKAGGNAASSEPEREPRLHHEFDTYYDTQDQGRWLLQRRIDGINAHETQIIGNSSCTALAPGVLMQPVDSEPAGTKETTYAVIAATHFGEISDNDIHATAEGSYGNAFTAIPGDESFRLQRKTRWPLVYGVMHAVVDGERCDDNAADDSDEDAYAYAEISANGEYRVRMPFDLAGRRVGEPASCWIRMAQSHSGKDYGMHFPLHVGTEVLISHIDGNPDRPVIVGTVPSSHTASPVNQYNSHQNVLRTSSGHQMVMDDMYGSQRIVIENAKSTVFEMYGRDFTAANEFTPSPASMLATGLDGRLFARADWAGQGAYRPGVSASHNADAGAGFYAIGDEGAVVAPTAAAAEAASADHGAAIAAPGASASANVASLGRGGGETAEEKIQDYIPRSFPSERFWDHFRTSNTVAHLDLGGNVADYVRKDFLEVFRIVDREKYLLPPGSLDAKNYEECQEDGGDKENRREVIAEPREKIQYLKPGSTEQGDPNLQCYKYTGSIGWQWINCGPEVGLQYGRVHKRTEGDVHTFHRGDRFHSHEQGDVYEFLHNRNHYVYRSGNDYRVGGGFEHRNTINEDLVEEDFVNRHDRQEVAFSYRLTAATTAHTELVATATHEQGLSATNSTRLRDITDRDLEIVHAKTVQRMIDAKRETRISGDDLVHIGSNHETVVKGKHLVNAANHEVAVPGTQSVKSGASTFLFKDGFTIKQDSAGDAPQPQDVEGELSSTQGQRLKDAEAMVNDAYRQNREETTHQAPADARQQDQPQPDSASGGGNGISLEAKQIIGKSTSSKIAWDAASNFEVKASSTVKVTANSMVQINGSSKVEIKGGQIHIG